MDASRQASAAMPSPRKTALVVGVLYLITHVTSIVAGVLYGRILNDPAYILASGPDTSILVAAFLEVILVVAIVGTGAVLYPFLKRPDQGVALSYLSLRTFEAVILAAGILPLLVIVTLRQQLAGTAGVDPAALVPLGQSLVSFHNWAHIFGANFIYGTHTVLLAYLLYRSRLVPRFIPVLCLVGGPAVFIIATAKMFGLIPEPSVWALIGAVPAFAWELSLALWLIVKGFNPFAAASSLEVGPAVEPSTPLQTST
jgi:hypothetical protein